MDKDRCSLSFLPICAFPLLSFRYVIFWSVGRSDASVILVIRYSWSNRPSSRRSQGVARPFRSGFGVNCPFSPPGRWGSLSIVFLFLQLGRPVTTIERSGSSPPMVFSKRHSASFLHTIPVGWNVWRTLETSMPVPSLCQAYKEANGSFSLMLYTGRRQKRERNRTTRTDISIGR